MFQELVHQLVSLMKGKNSKNLKNTVNYFSKTKAALKTAIQKPNNNMRITVING